MAQVSDDQKGESVSHRFHVTMDRRQVDQFNKVVSRNSGKETAPSLRVPLTFPATWYGLKEVQSSITETVDQAVGPEQYVLLHLEQTVEMFARLEVDKTYTLDIRIGALSKDRKIKVSAKVSDMQGVSLASMASLFAVLNSQEKRP